MFGSNGRILAESFCQDVAAVRKRWEARLVADVQTTEDLKGGRVKNRRRVLDLLRQNGGLNQADLVELTGLSRATVSSLVSELRQHDLVVNEELRKGPARTGRPPSMVALRKSVGASVGISVTQHAIQVAVGDLGLDVLQEQERRPTDFEIGQDPAATLRLAAEMVKEALADAGLDQSQVIGGVIALPAPIDTRDGTVGLSSVLPGWLGKPAAALESLVGFPILFANDANMAAFAEAVAGAVEGATQVLYVGASTYLGAGLIVNGRPYAGGTGGAGEIAHMTVQPRDGELCFCGRRGCLAMVVNATNMVAEVQSSHRRVLSTSEFDPEALDAPGLGLDRQLDLVVLWARGGDPISSRILRDAGRDLGIAVANVCQALNPERVVVGGILTGAGDVFMGPFTRAVHEHTTTLPGPPVPVVLSRWSERAELMGAVALGIRAGSDEFAARLWTLVETAVLDRANPHEGLSTA
jgi:predicted NBD/HSP70 family sugar kinase